jgi:hypothetical protein
MMQHGNHLPTNMVERGAYNTIIQIYKLFKQSKQFSPSLLDVPTPAQTHRVLASGLVELL